MQNCSDIWNLYTQSMIIIDMEEQMEQIEKLIDEEQEKITKQQIFFLEWPKWRVEVLEVSMFIYAAFEKYRIKHLNFSIALNFIECIIMYLCRLIVWIVVVHHSNRRKVSA